MNDILNRGALAAIGVRPGERLLDLGSATGQLTRDLARAAGGAAGAVAVERSRDQIEVARRLASAAGEEGLADFREGDALSPPLSEAEWGGFDLVHARFLCEHLPRPIELARIMVRAARPGGRIVIQDEDHDILRLWPEPEGVMDLWRAYIRSYEVQGNDPFIGRKLAALLHEAGASPVRSSWIDFGGCSGQPRFPALVENMARILEGAQGLIVEAGLHEQSACAEAVAALRRWALRPDAALYYAVACVEAARPEDAA
jgi:SAM-dependent methyltransferase